MTSEIYDEYYLDAKAREDLKKLFKRTRKMLELLRNANAAWYDEFKEQHQVVKILEDYNLRRIIRDPTFQSIDVVVIRKKLLEKWESRTKDLI